MSNATETTSDSQPLALPALRVYRTWAWTHKPGHELRLGGPAAPMELISRDVLQMQVNGNWLAVPVVEAPKPEHPGAAARRRQEEATAREMQELVAQMAATLRKT